MPFARFNAPSFYSLVLEHHWQCHDSDLLASLVIPIFWCLRDKNLAFPVCGSACSKSLKALKRPLINVQVLWPMISHHSIRQNYNGTTIRPSKPFRHINVRSICQPLRQSSFLRVLSDTTGGKFEDSWEGIAVTLLPPRVCQLELVPP